MNTQISIWLVFPILALLISPFLHGMEEVGGSIEMALKKGESRLQALRELESGRIVPNGVHVEVLTQILSIGNCEEQKLALEILARLGREARSAVPTVHALTKTQQTGINSADREYSIMSNGKRGLTPREIRLYAISTFVKISDVNSADVQKLLLELSGSNDPALRELVSNLLGEVPPTIESLICLRAFLSDESREVAVASRTSMISQAQRLLSSWQVAIKTNPTNELLLGLHSIRNLTVAMKALDGQVKTNGELQRFRGVVFELKTALEQFEPYRKAGALCKKGDEYLTKRQWDDAFNCYLGAFDLVGETEEVMNGMRTAKKGYADDHNQGEK